MLLGLTTLIRIFFKRSTGYCRGHSEKLRKSYSINQSINQNAFIGPILRHVASESEAHVG